MNKKIYKKFASVAVKVGINLQKGQEVYITISTRQNEFAKYLVKECYLNGAKKVVVDWYDEEISRLDYKYAEAEVLSRLKKYEIEKAKYKGETHPCLIYVDDDNPNAFDGLDMKKIIDVNNKRRKAIKKYRDMSDNKDQWLIISVPSIEWAKLVFPSEKANVAYKKLWEAIIKTTRLDNDDPVKAWEDHVNELKAKASILNNLHLDYLKYSSSNGTDLKIKLHPNHLWEAASEKNIYGIEFVANMPTEEVFTMPLKTGVDGVVCSSKPLSYNGSLIEDFKCYFKDGVCYKVEAKKGQEVLEGIIKADAASCRLGEVALVPYNSPINETGILFFNTLFDENAACHLAFGQSFKDNIIGYENMTDEDFKKLEINDSIVHVDFMVGTKDLEILGYDKDGKEYKIFENGLWAI